MLLLPVLPELLLPVLPALPDLPPTETSVAAALVAAAVAAAVTVTVLTAVWQNASVRVRGRSHASWRTYGTLLRVRRRGGLAGALVVAGAEAAEAAELVRRAREHGRRGGEGEEREEEGLGEHLDWRSACAKAKMKRRPVCRRNGVL